jgi:heme A synthase
MAVFHALLVGGGLLTLALVVMTYRGGARPDRFLVITLVACLISGASALYVTNRHSGTGTLLSRGFPKPFHFQWQDREVRTPPRHDINFVYYGANTFVYLGAISLMAALLSRRRDPSAHTMPAGMVFLRIALGVFLLILGVIGGFIPILQGWIFILLGLLVLFPKAKFTEKVLHKAEPKVPRTVAFLRKFGIGRDHQQDQPLP